MQLPQSALWHRRKSLRLVLSARDRVQLSKSQDAMGHVLSASRRAVRYVTVCLVNHPQQLLTISHIALHPPQAVFRSCITHVRVRGAHRVAMYIPAATAGPTSENGPLLARCLQSPCSLLTMQGLCDPSGLDSYPALPTCHSSASLTSSNKASLEQIWWRSLQARKCSVEFVLYLAPCRTSLCFKAHLPA